MQLRLEIGGSFDMYRFTVRTAGKELDAGELPIKLKCELQGYMPPYLHTPGADEPAKPGGTRTTATGLKFRETKGGSWKWTVELSADDAEGLQREARAARIHAAPEGMIGLDGTTWTLSLEAGFCQVRYSWWGGPNRRWKALAQLSDRLLALSRLQEILPRAYEDYLSYPPEGAEG